MARSSSFPDLHFLSVTEELEGYEEKTKAFNEILSRNKQKEKLQNFFKEGSCWERQMVESVFHIYYNNSFYESPYDVLKKLIHIDELTEEQYNYIRCVQKYLHFTTDVNELHFFGDKVVASKLIPLLKQLDNEPEEYLKRHIHKFIVSVTRLVNQLKLCSNVSNVCDGAYTNLFCCFADMCCLEAVMNICKVEQITGRNFRSLNKVVSRPDIRLYKYGELTKSSRDSETVVAVVKIKKNRHQREPESSDSEGSMDSLSSISSRSSNTSDYRPGIAWTLNRQVLGQHAGELLLNLQQFVKKESDSTIYMMPGMIVKQTEVYFTLLEISKNHYEKLDKNLELDDTDKAVIYYSKPYDILKEEYRNSVIENLIRLNNIRPS